MRGLFRSGLVWVSLGLAGACSNIIGISEYEIDPALDPRPDGEGGSGNEGGSSNNGGSPQPGAGQGGEPSSSAGNGGSSGSGQAGEPAQDAGGMGGTNAEPCTAAACDDTIDCTIDSCDENGACQHIADSSLCDADEDECVVCQLGIGCVPGVLASEQLLLDPNFDDRAGDWVEVIQYTTNQSTIVTADTIADSGGYSAWYLGVVDTATRQSYLDLFQYVTIPPNTKQLRVSGVYQLLNGMKAPAEDYIVAGLYEGSATLLEFHDWAGDEAEADVWTAFDYLAPRAKLQDVLGMEVTFDIYGYSWDSEFYFDTLSLEATVCNDP